MISAIATDSVCVSPQKWREVFESYNKNEESDGRSQNHGKGVCVGGCASVLCAL